jgi:dUTP pyrophosphatase
MQGQLLVVYDKILKDVGFILEPAKPGDVGLDLPVVMDERLKIQPHQDYYINLKERWFDIPPMGVAEVPCGMSIKVPDDAWANIKPRSSTGWKKRLTILEGVIDSGYIGPLFISVTNPNKDVVRICEFDKLAQLIVTPKYRIDKICAVSELPKTERGATGFGSSSVTKRITLPPKNG